MKRFSNSLIATLIITLLMAVVSLPDSVKSKLPNDPVSTWVKAQKITLGLDLQGGTQLDYRIDLRSAKKRNEDDDSSNDVRIHDVIEGVRTTIERRVNGLGVSEPQIYTSNIAGEEHIIVELAGIKDIDKAKKIVGKTIQLEFKEPKTELDTDERGIIEKEANAVLKNTLKTGVDFTKIGESIQTSDKKIEFLPGEEKFLSQLTDYHKNSLVKLRVGQVYNGLLEGVGEYYVDRAGEFKEKKSLRIIKLTGKEKKENSKTEGEDRVRASHILIAYEGAERADKDIIRSKKEAQAEAERILEEAKAGDADFAELAKQYSDGPSGSNGGDLDFFGHGQMTKDFEDAAFALEIDGISEVVETEFGFHIIKATDKEESTEAKEMEDFYTFSEIVFDISPDPWKATGLDGSHFQYASVSYNQIGAPQVNIQFNSAGADLFEDITGRLAGKQLAIFVGGELISAPRVNEKISGGSAVITGNYSLKEALQLANDLNTGAIDAPIILSGQYTISATLGDNALRLSLFAGIIGIIALVIFMLLYYRMFGLLANISLIIYAIIIIFVLKSTPIVMTLAGIAGIILSIGMAVDANILIFERTKEELAEGKNFTASVQTGFERAWSSIRDSNVSSLITCLILWFFGNSIIRGFALMLGLGIIVSMFTAITVTRAFLHTLRGTKITKSKFLLGVKRG